MKIGEFETNHIYNGDSYNLIKGIPDKTIDCCYNDYINYIKQRLTYSKGMFIIISQEQFYWYKELYCAIKEWGAKHPYYYSLLTYKTYPKRALYFEGVKSYKELETLYEALTKQFMDFITNKEKELDEKYPFVDMEAKVINLGGQLLKYARSKSEKPFD